MFQLLVTLFTIFFLYSLKAVFLTRNNAHTLFLPFSDLTVSFSLFFLSSQSCYNTLRWKKWPFGVVKWLFVPTYYSLGLLPGLHDHCKRPKFLWNVCFANRANHFRRLDCIVSFVCQCTNYNCGLLGMKRTSSEYFTFQLS